MKAKTSTEVLQAAKWILENVGWTRKQFTKTNGKGKVVGVCASQALYSVEIDNDTYGYIRGEARRRLEEVIGNDIVGFNDRPSTKKRDVVRAFKKAIERGSK